MNHKLATICFSLSLLLGVGFMGPAAATPAGKRVEKVGLKKASVVPAFVRKAETNYSIKVPQTRVRDQERSGRCWAFAWTKTLQTMAKSKGNDVGPLSPSFINYHALRDLAFGAINQAVRTAKRSEYSLYYLSADMVSEGGYSHWANAIVKEHGIVPETKMSSRTFDSRESDLLQNLVHRVVTAAYRDINRTSITNAEKRQELAGKYKDQVVAVLDKMIGAPPKRFTIGGKTYTPDTYRREVLGLADSDLEFVNLSHDPTRAWNRAYRDSFSGKGIPDHQTYNVPMKTIKAAVKKTLKEGVAVNVAVNVDWDNPHRVANRADKSSKANGVLSLKAVDYGKLVPGLSKYDRMEHGVSLSNHMMAITGHEPAHRGHQARWLIDNSHGTKSFRAGRFDMYDDYFRQYVEEVTVPRGALPAGLLAKLDGKPPLDTVEGMNLPPSKGGDRWTPLRKRALVKALMRSEFSFDEAAERYNLPAKTIREWYDKARKATIQALR